MNGFDFDALRDPVAPDPGARQRAGVAGRARELRGRARRTRLLAGAASFVAIAAIAGGVVALTRSTGPSITVEGGGTTLPPTTTPTTYGPSVDSRFIPSTFTKGGWIVLPVTLPDGETFTMRYPPAVKIAQLGFAGGINVSGKQLSISYTTIQSTYGGSPLKTLPGANGTQVSLFHANQRSGYLGPNVEELAYQFDKWLAVVEAPVDAADQARWARDLSGTTDANGYLVLHATGPLSVGNAFEGGFGKVPGNALELASHLYCGQSGSDTSSRRRQTNGDGSKFVSWCDGELHVTADGTSPFLDAAGKLRVSPLLPAGVSSKPNPPQLLPAESASFVSADEGFLLQEDGACHARGCKYQIAQTTDGGRTWTTIGPVGRLPYQARIRFADARHGFAYAADPNSSPLPMLTTDDGGEHWKQPPTPFSNISDLAVSRGTVYVVGIPAGTPTNSAFPGFRIWSMAVGGSTWHMDPLVIPTGAGPVPQQQLVLSGKRGWMINSDRGIVSGARLSPATGRWSDWTPPCKDVNGAASLSASTGTDLVAVCTPGFASSSTTTYIEFSHDAGNTFNRRTVPADKYGAGGPISPDPHTAIIGVDIQLLQTTDEGQHWRTALKSDALTQQADASSYVAMSDYGFTTTTQGFVVMDNGNMFMTYDGGTSWTRVTLP